MLIGERDLVATGEIIDGDSPPAPRMRRREIGTPRMRKRETAESCREMKSWLHWASNVVFFPMLWRVFCLVNYVLHVISLNMILMNTDSAPVHLQYIWIAPTHQKC